MGLHRKIWCVSPRQSCSEVLMGAWFLDPLTLNIFAVYLWLFLDSNRWVHRTGSNLKHAEAKPRPK
jgi:hypothetical protein